MRAVGLGTQVPLGHRDWSSELMSYFLWPHTFCVLLHGGTVLVR